MTTPHARDRFEPIVEPVCRAHGLELVQVRKLVMRGETVLRVLIDRPLDSGSSGVTLGDCQAVSRDLGPALDVNETVSGSYRLEVSSPGLDRPLVKLRDFERFAGRKVAIKTRSRHPDGRGGERRKFTGRLLGVDGDAVCLSVDASELSFPYADIDSANVVYEY